MWRDLVSHSTLCERWSWRKISCVSPVAPSCISAGKKTWEPYLKLLKCGSQLGILKAGFIQQSQVPIKLDNVCCVVIQPWFSGEKNISNFLVFLPKATEKKERANKQINKYLSRRAILLPHCISPTVATDVVQLNPTSNGRKEAALHWHMGQQNGHREGLILRLCLCHGSILCL